MDSAGPSWPNRFREKLMTPTQLALRGGGVDGRRAMMSPVGFLGLRLGQIRSLLKWLGIVIPMASVVGSLCALFLWGLDRATQARFAYPWLIYGMPVAGFLMVLAYQRFGRAAEGGNNLIVEQIHEPGGGVPLRMAPFILVTTVLTHLVGGSAGREGTAVQLGGSIASAFGKTFNLSAADMRILLMAGIAAGFGAVFGTPIAGAIFALEVLTIGRMQYEALLPCLMAAIAGDWSCHAWGVEHTHYAIAYLAGSGETTGFHLNALLLVKVGIAGVVFGLAARFFSEFSHLAGAAYKMVCPYAPLRPVIASAILIGLVYALGTREYLGLGVWSPNPGDATIAGFFHPGHVDQWSWLWKTIFTLRVIAASTTGRSRSFTATLPEGSMMPDGSLKSKATPSAPSIVLPERVAALTASPLATSDLTRWRPTLPVAPNTRILFDILLSFNSMIVEGTFRSHGFANETGRGHRSDHMQFDYDVYQENCPNRSSTCRVGDKWALLILDRLDGGPVRFNHLRRDISGISQKVLSQTLKKLERDGLISRTVFPTVPITVEYALTPLGRTLTETVNLLAHWAE
eukprot:gene30683-40796_t